MNSHLPPPSLPDLPPPSIPPPSIPAPARADSAPVAAPAVGVPPPSKKKPAQREEAEEPDASLNPGEGLADWVVAAVRDCIAYPWRKSGWSIVIPGAVFGLLLWLGGFAPVIGSSCFMRGWWASSDAVIGTRSISADAAHSPIHTGVPSGTRSKSSITSALRMRTQPWLPRRPMPRSSLVPWM